MRTSIATVSVGGTLDEKLEAIAAARFDGIEIFDADLVASPDSPGAIAARCADLGLSIELYQPIRDVEGTPPERFEAVLRRVRGKFAVMEQLGADRVLVCSNCRADALLDDMDLYAEQLHAVGDLAAEHGITVGYEALAWGRTTSLFGQAWDVVRRAGHSSVGVVVDTFHMLGRGQGAEALGDVPGEAIAFLQIADAPRMGMAVLDWSRHFRCFPGQGNLDITPLVAEVYERGYRGPLSLEIFSDVVREAPPRATALDAMRSLLHLEESLRRRWEAPPFADRRPRSDLFDPAPAPRRVEPAFVEIAFATAAEREAIETTLAGLGFTHAGRHRTKPVDWWRNDAADVVLNGAPGGPPLSVTALAVQVDDPTDVATRAGAMLWPRARTRRTAADVPLPGLDSPSGLVLFLSGPQGYAECWQNDFDGIDAPGAPAGPGDWLGVDHVGASIDPVLLPAEQSFFRTVLGMTAGALSEFMQPGGRMRSRPLAPEQGSLRVILSVDDGTRPDEARRGLNQVAFAVPDVLAVARAARDRGLGLMPVPDNYYVDLAGAYDLSPERVAELRAHGVLYDRHDDGSELLHLYTPLLGNGFYIEMVQRIGGYDGYGAPNTHIRLAAQARQHARRTAVPATA